MTQLLIGGFVGVISALVGGTVQHRLSRRTYESSSERLPGCALILVGSLGFAGVMVGLISLILTRSLELALIPGVGVIIGFVVGFALMFLLWYIGPKRK